MSFLLALADAAPLPTGRITGGWEYIWTAYILTWSGVVLYGASLFLRRRKT